MAKTKRNWPRASDIVNTVFIDDVTDMDTYNFIENHDLAGCEGCGMTFHEMDMVTELCWNCLDDKEEG